MTKTSGFFLFVRDTVTGALAIALTGAAVCSLLYGLGWLVEYVPVWLGGASAPATNLAPGYYMASALQVLMTSVLSLSLFAFFVLLCFHAGRAVWSLFAGEQSKISL